MSDETVRVPAALVEALREELEKGFAEWGTRGEPGSLSWLSWNVVDAAERPDEGDGDGFALLYPIDGLEDV